MTRTLSFDDSKGATAADWAAWQEALWAWLPQYEEVRGRRIVVRVESNARITKSRAARELAKSTAYHGIDTWEAGPYKFDFRKRTYLWRGVMLHITEQEALYLYRRLVLNDDAHKRQCYYLRDMRKRFRNMCEFQEETFLAEYTGGAGKN
jgi:hypothetical protein